MATFELGQSFGQNTLVKPPPRITSVQESFQPVATQKSKFTSRPPPKVSRSLVSRSQEIDSAVWSAKTIDFKLLSSPSQNAFPMHGYW